ncbi:hypothetical protein DPMN_185540 [Dreissena polymorpha]|uniref:Uncharacterized protein n=1 Tax=Dreissena polymorpha TaxID=45954 RepID=A0A9D4I7E1_DREPO|nr:hypothetical protein DPMN_185540 [Dreissena polymorpha]
MWVDHEGYITLNQQRIPEIADVSRLRVVIIDRTPLDPALKGRDAITGPRKISHYETPLIN